MSMCARSAGMADTARNMNAIPHAKNHVSSILFCAILHRRRRRFSRSLSLARSSRYFTEGRIIYDNLICQSVYIDLAKPKYGSNRIFAQHTQYSTSVRIGLESIFWKICRTTKNNNEKSPCIADWQLCCWFFFSLFDERTLAKSWTILRQ